VLRQWPHQKSSSAQGGVLSMWKKRRGKHVLPSETSSSCLALHLHIVTYAAIEVYLAAVSLSRALLKDLPHAVVGVSSSCIVVRNSSLIGVSAKAQETNSSI